MVGPATFVIKKGINSYTALASSMLGGCEVGYLANGGGYFRAPLNNQDGSLWTTFADHDEVTVELDATKMLDAYITKRRRYVTGEGKKFLILSGLDVGFELTKKTDFEADYQFDPTAVSDVMVDAIAQLGNGVTSTGVDVITDTIRKNFSSTYVLDVISEVARIADATFFFDENKVAQAFRSGVRSSSKTITEALMRGSIAYEEDGSDKYNEVIATNETSEIIPADPTYFGQTIVGWGLTDLNIAVDNGFQGNPAVKFTVAGTPALVIASRGSVTGASLDITEADWDRIAFDILHNLTALLAAKIRLEQDFTNHWEADITLKMVSGNWSHIELNLHNKTPTDWVKTGTPTKINNITLRMTSSTTLSGSFSVQLLRLIRKVRSKQGVGGTPTLTKILIDPTISKKEDLVTLATKEEAWAKTVEKRAEILRIDGDKALRNPGYTAVLDMATIGLGGVNAVTVTMKEIKHKVIESHDPYITEITLGNIFREKFGPIFQAPSDIARRDFERLSTVIP